MNKKAMFYEKENNKIRCLLCPHFCLLKENQTGICNVRKVLKDENGLLELYSLNYGEITSIAVDPIEKKPLYHFYPNTQILSVGSFGCNFKCSFCQNYSIAHNKAHSEFCTSESLIDILSQYPQSIGLAFTYNEPAIWYEYVYDTAKLLKENMPNKKVVLVTNGYINEGPLRNLLKYVDAINIDLKGDNNFYKELCAGSAYEVKETIKIAYETGCHIEVTTLLIGGKNTNENQLLEIGNFLSSIDKDLTLHISRYFPQYKLNLPPTSLKELKRAYKLLKEILPNVEIGNVSYEEKVLLNRD